MCTRDKELMRLCYKCMQTWYAVVRSTLCPAPLFVARLANLDLHRCMLCLITAALANGKQPMPQAAIAYLCEINKSTPCRDGIPVLTQDMCFNAFARLANPNEPVETYEQKVISYVRETVKRLRYANSVMPEVKDDVTSLSPSRSSCLVLSSPRTCLWAKPPYTDPCLAFTADM
jgi:hypothetical protein